MEGKKVLLVDTDPQASLTVSLGNPYPDTLSPTLSDMMGKIMTEKPIAPGEGILHHPEGVDLMPANIELSGLEVSLVNAMSRETILRQYLDTVKQNYDYILLDCMPSLGMLTVNALAAADNVLIPVQAAYLPAKGLEQLLETINKVKKVSSQLLHENGHEPSAEEIAERLDMPVDKVREIMRVAQEPVSLETPIGEEEDSHLGDFIPDEEAPVPAEAASQTLLKEQLADVLKTLTPREEKVLRLRFGLEDGRPRTLEEVGKEFNVTRERIRQIEAKALRKLRHPSRSKKLRDFLD